MYIFRKPTVSCIFILLILGLFLTCDDLSNPFSNNLGEKVVVEPPTVNIEYPVSGAYLTGDETFKGTAKAYIEVRKVEVYVYPNEENRQEEIKWTDRGIQLSGNAKNKTWTYKFPTKNYNSGNDGSIRLKFRVHDSKSIEESIDLVYIIKNNPSDIKMASPDNTEIAEDPLAEPKIRYGGEIRGQVIDRRGLRPGYPQIKIWPNKLFPNGEPDDDDPQWGYASLFLPGTGSPEAGYDDIQKEGADKPAGPGTYADRRKMPVVRAAQFSFRLAEFMIEKVDDELRYIRYVVNDKGEHNPFKSGDTYSFRIRTKDTSSDSANRMLPTDDGPFIKGCFPPLNFGTPDENTFAFRREPVKVLIFNDNTMPTVRINNDDIAKETLDARPNIYITEPTAKKIAVGKAGRSDFRLRVLATVPNGTIEKASLKYEHQSTGRFGPLKWDCQTDPSEPCPGEPYGDGKLFTFTADGGLSAPNLTKPSNPVEPVFTHHTEPYTLIVTVWSGGLDTDWRYTVYMDGEGPNVSIRSVRGAAAEPEGGVEDILDDSSPQKPIPGFLKNKNAYTVNGNIQVAVDRTDNSGIMAKDGYPVVKWIVEEDKTGYDTATDTILQKLKDFRTDPKPLTLDFFSNIEETQNSGWVKLPSSDGKNDADKVHNFKFNTSAWNKKTLWLYVIAQDSVQNLGFIMQKIYVDEDTDKPRLEIPTLSHKNAGGAAITGEGNLDVVVGEDKTMSGNWSASAPKMNILEKDQYIELNLLDDDGINIDSGVSIKLTDLNVTPNKTVTLTAAQVKSALSAGNSKDMSGTLSQAVMAQCLYGLPSNSTTPLKDGMYRIDITVNDDDSEDAKVWIDGVNPGSVSVSDTYYFAVFTEVPEIDVKYPKEDMLGSDNPIPIYGSVKSRLKVQRLWITFTPDVISDPPKDASSTPKKLTLYADNECTKPFSDPLSEVTPNADGDYTYYWKMPDDVIFHPKKTPSGDPYFDYELRRFSLEAYDRLGNVSNLTRTVQIDITPPDVMLIDFNRGRSAAQDGTQYLYGKVPFTVSASDANGLMELGGYSSIKWWVLPEDVTPNWNNPAFPSYNGWTGGGNFLLSEAEQGGRYTGVIDTRKLTEFNGAARIGYRLYIIAMDKAGNQSLITPAACPDFKVDQSLDYPVIDENLLTPQNGSILEKTASPAITGTVSDADLFDANKSGYVEIRYPETTDPATGEPTAWVDWIKVPATLNAARDLDFTFNWANNDYFEKDGTKYYQIRVTDEPDEGKDNYGKNPDGAKAGDPNYHGSVSKIFPSDTTGYNFFVDNTDPEIFFNLYDPTEGHQTYAKDRPTFSKWEDLMKALLGTVKEDYLSTVSFSYGNKSKTIVNNPPLAIIHNWNVNTIRNGTAETVLTVTDPVLIDLFSPFNDAPQGPQNIVMEAIDMAGNKTTVSWTFYKDTQGPEIIFNNIARAITRPASTIPAAADFPNGSGSGATKGPAWPSDWPNGTKWQDPVTGWHGDWIAMIAAWPSDYAFFTGTFSEKVKQVRDALTAENGRAPSVVSGNASVVPVIQGTFYDALSSVRKPSPAITNFEYRFTYRNSTQSAWLSKPIEPAASGQKDNSANWEIVLNSSVFAGLDGENFLDIKIKDSAGNESFIYGVRFLVDRANPVLNEPKDFTVNINSNNPLPNPESRVFSAAWFDTPGSLTSTTGYFDISGRVRDFNLSNLQITLGQDVSTAYTVTASLEIEPLNAVPGSNTGVVTPAPYDTVTVTGTADPSPGLRRLSLSGPYNPGTTTNYNSATEPPEWVWTFRILEKDIAGLRAAAPTAANSARRFITVTTSDKARNRAGPEVWEFYLDTRKPDIEYTTLEKGADGVTFDNTVTLSGIVSDDTGILDLRYMIGKWDYANKVWEWNDNGSWVAEANRPVAADWPKAVPSIPARQTTLNWTISQDMLTAIGAAGEGKYRLELYTSDWSFGNGNPHNTMDSADTNFSDNGYSITAGTGNASGRIFYIDKSDPVLDWLADVKSQTYFKNTGGQVSFGFTTSDPNTIQRWEAEIKDESGAVVLRNGYSADGTQVSDPKGTIPAPSSPSLSFTSVGVQTLSIKPFMTDDGTSGGTALDLVSANTSGKPKTYTITLTVVDGAKKSKSETKQFILDNRLPVLGNLRPESFINGTPATYEAVTGKMNIRGNTTDNSNQLKRVAFYLPKAGPDGDTSTYDFPNPITITNDATITNPDGWHWHDPDNAGSYKIDIDGTTVINIEQGTFAWEIRVPQTSLFFNDMAVKNAGYVQWTKTGGTTSNGGSSTAKNYRDVNTTTWLTTSATVPALTFQDLMKTDPDDKTIYGGEDVGLMTVYILAEDMAGNVTYEVLKYWLWPEGDRPQVTSIINPDSNKIQAERLLNGTIRLSGLAKDNEQVKYVWFRVLRSNGQPYTNLHIPTWNESTWDPDTSKPEQTSLDAAPVVNGITAIGSIRGDDPLGAYTGGWYKANGGNSRIVSWSASINTQGELDPEGFEANEITVEVRVQDVTWDDGTNDWKIYTPSYKGFASKPLSVKAWVVAGAPIFDNVRVANGASDTVLWEEKENGIYKTSIDRASIRNRSSYRVTVKHNSGISAIRWSPTEWTGAGFRANPNVEAYNLLSLGSGQYVYFNGNTSQIIPKGDASTPGTAFYLLDQGTISMAVTVEPRGMKTSSSAALDSGKTYLIWKWDEALVTSGAFTDNDSYKESDGTRKKMENTIFSPPATASYPIGSAVLIESDPEGDVDYFKWDVTVDVRADLLLSVLSETSVRYPVYLSATEISRATPLTTRGDTLLPIDNQAPNAVYTLNRKPAGIAATIGGEAGDDYPNGNVAPVKGIARVVLWFQRKEGAGTKFISWHELGTPGSSPALAPDPRDMKDYEYVSGGPAWWDNIRKIGDNGDSNYIDIIPANVIKPELGGETDDTGGDWAIVIDRNSPSVGQAAWGHRLPMGFADGGMGKYWYVEINSLGITSGPVTLHYVVIDKAGNAQYYSEKLVIMNNAAVINKIRLATDIRDNFGTNWAANTRVGKGTTAEPTGAETDGRNQILQTIWNGFSTGNNYVQRGITEEIYSGAMGAEKIIDFNVRNKLFALRVETTGGPATGKDRRFRLEYVSGAKLLTDAGLSDIKAGRVYIINEPGTAKWGIVGAEGDGPWSKGYAFLAFVDGKDGSKSRFDGNATGSVWELNPDYQPTGEREAAANVPPALRLGDVKYTDNGVNADAVSAEFVYFPGAFGTTAGGPNATIVDTAANDTDVFPPASSQELLANSMFIIRVFDGDEEDMFGDFTIIRVRVNNDDRTRPFAQVYDINPKTEGQERQNIAQNDQDAEQRRSLAPMFIGEGTGSNRTKGSLWNIAPKQGDVAKSGHIEPRKITYTPEPYKTQQHSLSSAQMGGAATRTAATIQKPFADPDGFFATDTVSGRVVLRGYVEDNERIERVELRIGVMNNNNVTNVTSVTILEYNNAAASGGNSANFEPPSTGLLRVPNGTPNPLDGAVNPSQVGKVYFTDTIDLYRHRVEWAYIWDTETLPAVNNAGTVAGQANVRVVAYNRNSGAVKESESIAAADGKGHSNTSLSNRPNTSPSNPGLPTGIIEYNSISMNLRPYITGFRRDQSAFAHNTRSRQGWYMFARNEQVVVAGFNLAAGTNGVTGPNITVGGVANNNIGAATGQAASHAITGDDNFANTRHFRTFTVDATGATGNGAVTLTLNNYAAVNTRPAAVPSNETAASLRPLSNNRPYIQPWNIEYSSGIDGSELWDDFTQAHIWQSDDNTGDNGGRFASSDNWVILSPAMSIDPANGTLYESHNEGGNGGTSNDIINTGTTRRSAITQTTRQDSVMQFIDPIIFSDIYRSPGGGTTDTAADTWVVSSIIGRNGTNKYWRAFGGIYIYGPGGTTINLSGGGNSSFGSNESNNNNTSLYLGESAWYNSSSDWRPTNPPSTDQFMNPHIVTSYSANGTREHIHVSYYDDKDKSLKYRYNLRGRPGYIVGAGNNTPADDGSSVDIIDDNRDVPRMWTNLDGSFDDEDTEATAYAHTDIGSTVAGSIPANTRVVNQAGRGNINAGKHNSIAVTSQGYPVIAYYDQTNQRLKLAVSRSVAPILAADWVIRDYVIPRTNLSSFGTGEFVSMKINTVAGANPGQELNRVHIAAMNTSKRLVYITGTLNPPAVSAGTYGGQQDEDSPNNVLTNVQVQVVDSVGNVGRWCSLSLDKDGNPWISYMDESYVGSRDGVKVAFLNKSAFYKGVNTGTVAAPAGYCPGQYIDLYGTSLEGWETMHVPTTYRVENPVEGPGREHGRLGMECFPARNFNPTSDNRIWSAAISYLSQDAVGNIAAMDRYRIAYYVK